MTASSARRSMTTTRVGPSVMSNSRWFALTIVPKGSSTVSTNVAICSSTARGQLRNAGTVRSSAVYEVGAMRSLASVARHRGPRTYGATFAQSSSGSVIRGSARGGSMNPTSVGCRTRTVLVGSGRGVRRGPVPDLPEVVVGRALTRSGAARAGGRHPTRRPGAAARARRGRGLGRTALARGAVRASAGSLVRGDRAVGLRRGGARRGIGPAAEPGAGRRGTVLPRLSRRDRQACSRPRGSAWSSPPRPSRCW